MSVAAAEEAFNQNELEFPGENVRHQSADTGVEPCGTESYRQESLLSSGVHKVQIMNVKMSVPAMTNL